MPDDLNKWVLVFVRGAALLAVFPIFSMKNFPRTTRVALGFALAMLVAPMVGPLAVNPDSFTATIILVLKETAVGVLLGFVTRILFYLLEFAGSLIATEMGLNMASMVSPLESGRSEAPGTMFYYLGGALFLALDLHHWLLMGFMRSFELVPIGGLRLSAGIFTDITGRTSQIFLIALLMAAPVIAVSFLVNLVFSVLGRAVPQMNVFVESFSFRILSGLIVLSMSFNLVAQHVVNYLRRLPSDFLRVAQLLGAA
jgi:flagellar biosynthetic protein FliR